MDGFLNRSESLFGNLFRNYPPAKSEFSANKDF